MSARIFPGLLLDCRAMFLNSFSNEFAVKLIILNSEIQSSTRDHPGYTILDSLNFDNFMLVGDLSAKALQILETCVLANNSSC